jgi:carbon starvation protein CstA
MNAFIISVAVFIAGYIFYETVVEWRFGVENSHPTPATTIAGGVDFISLKLPKIFLIQFLNIAGLGPIFGFTILLLAVGIGGMMIIDGLPVPELTQVNFYNMNSGIEKFPIFQMLFVTMAFRAISGFHFTQTLVMAHCRIQELYGHGTFYYFTPKI